MIAPHDIRCAFTRPPATRFSLAEPGMPYEYTLTLRAYGVAALATLAALLARFALDPFLGNHLPYVTFFVAVVGVVWHSRALGPSLVVIALGAVASEWFFSDPRYTWNVSSVRDQVGLASYFMVTLAFLGFGQALHKSRHRAEVTARQRDEQHERLRTTLASIGDGVITTDSQGQVTTINDVAECLTGWKKTEAIGQPLEAVFRIVNEESRETVENPASRVLKEGVIVALANHTVLIAKDGTERPIDDSAAPIRCKDGELVGCVLVFRDVTERRDIERRLRESERRKAAVIHAALDCIIKIDHEGRIIEFNPAAEATFGHRRDGVLGRQMADLIIPPSMRERHVQGMARYLATGEGPILDKRIELTAVRADGGEFPVELTVSRLPVDGPPIFVGFLRDITERWRAESLLRASEQHNASLVQNLRESDRRKNEFLAMLAHELRSPLAAIRNAVQVLGLSGGNAAYASSASEMIKRQVGHMVRLVDDLIDVSRVSRGKIELRREPVELASVVNHAIEAAQMLVQCKGHQLAVSLPPTPLYLNADRARLAQVLDNLLNNACKFTDKGGRISIAVQREGERAVIRVRDNGIGIAAEQLSNIFDMFMQVDTSLERSMSGLGIGLTLVRNLVELHEGTVDVLSEGLGQGSEFVVRLPIMAETHEMPEPTAIEPAPARLRRILVVDDNRDSAESLAMLLELEGYRTHLAHDGLEAVAAAASFKPEVVLLDIGLPKLNGYDAGKRIREQPGGRDLVLVALTGWGQQEARQRSREAGFDGHLVKPVELAALRKLLGELEGG